MPESAPKLINRLVWLHVYATAVGGHPGRQAPCKCAIAMNALPGEVSVLPALDASVTLGEGLAQGHGGADDGAKPADLVAELKKLGFCLPDTHLQVLMDWAYNRTLQVGIRRPYDEDQRRLPVRIGDLADRQAMAGVVPHQLTLVFDRLYDAATRFTQLHERYGFLCALDPEGAASRFRLTETRYWHGNHDGTETAEQGVHDDKIEDRDAIDARLIELAKAYRAAIWHSAIGADLEKTVNATFALTRCIGDHATDPKAAKDLSGYKTVWSEVELFDTEHHGQLISRLLVPYALALSDNSLMRLADLPETFEFEDGRQPLTEGYHLFRVVPDTSKELERLTKRDEQFRGISPEAPKLRAMAHDRLLQQFKRDRSLLSVDLRKAVAAEGHDPVKGHFIAPFHAGVNNRVSPVRAATGPGSDGSCVREGALLITLGDDDGAWHVHVLKTEAEYAVARADLLANQSAHKTHNMVPLSTVSFIAGRLYSDPTVAMIKKKLWSKLKRNFHWKKKGVLLAATATGMFLLSTAGVGGLVLPLIGLGFVAFKRITTNAFIINPERALKDKDLVKKYLFEEVENTDNEAYKNDFFSFPNSQVKVQLGDDELETLAREARVIREEAGGRALTKEDKAAAKAVDKERKENADKLMTGDVGDILRRAFVHFLRAAKLLKADENESDAKRDARHAAALHHIEKGWRFMGPSIYYLGIAWRNYKQARALWQVQSPETSKVLLDEFDRLGISRDRKTLVKSLKTSLKPVFPKRMYYHVKKYAKAAWTRKRPRNIVMNETSAMKIFKRQLDEFEKNAFGIGKGAPGLDAELIAEVGGPELYAEWQLRGGRLEPYNRYTTAVTTHKRGSHIDLGGIAKRESHAKIDEEIKTLCEVVGFRMDLYHALEPRSKDDPVRRVTVANAGAEPDIYADLSAALQANDGRIETAWGKANKWTPGKAFYHVGRNWKDKRTAGEIIKSSLATAGEFVGGTWMSFGFGAFFDRMQFKPDGDGLMFRVFSDPLESPDSDPDGEKKTAEALDAIQAEMEHNEKNERVDRAVNKVAFAGAFGAAKLVMNLTCDQVMGKVRGDKMNDAQFLGTRTTAAKQRGKTIATFLNAHAVESTASSAPELAPGADLVDSGISLKKGAAFVGENLTKRIGAGMLLMAEQQEDLLRLTGQRLIDEKAGLVDSAYGTITRDQHIKAVDELIAKTALLSEYYSVMSNLEVDYMACQTYMNMLGYVGCQIEDNLFEQMGLDGPYSMNRVHSELGR